MSTTDTTTCSMSPERVREINVMLGVREIDADHNLISPLKMEAAIFVLNRDNGLSVEEATQYVKCRLTAAFEHAMYVLNMPEWVAATVAKFESGELDYRLLE